MVDDPSLNVEPDGNPEKCKSGKSPQGPRCGCTQECEVSSQSANFRIIKARVAADGCA